MFQLTKKIKHLICIAFFLQFSLSAHAQNNTDELVLAIFAHQEKPRLQNAYQDLVDHINRYLTQKRLTVKLMSHDEIIAASKNKTIDLIFANPYVFEYVRNNFSLKSTLATAQRNSLKHPTALLGGVIFTLAKQDITTLSDLEHKTIAIPNNKMVGAYMVPLHELWKNAIDIETIRFVETKGGHDSVLDAVLNQQADVGFIRTGAIEGWLDANKVARDKLKVIHPQPVTYYPYMVSTNLYPDWAFASFSHVDEETTKQLLAALMTYLPQKNSRLSQYLSGFAPALNYAGYEHLLTDLKLPPYYREPEVSFGLLLETYLAELSILLILFIFLIFYLIKTQQMSNALELASEASKKQSAQLSSIIDATKVGTWEWEVTTGKVTVNEYWYQMLGYRADEILPVSYEKWAKLIHPDDLQSTLAQLEKALASTNESYNQEIRLQHADGHWLWVLSRGMVTRRNQKGAPICMMGTHTDISKIKESEAQLANKALLDETLLALSQEHEKLPEAKFLTLALNKLEKLTQSQGAMIHQVDHQEHPFHLLACSGNLDMETLYDAAEPEFHPKVAAALERAFLKQTFVTEKDFDRDELSTMPFERFIAFPVVEHHETRLIITLGNKTQSYRDNDQNILKEIAQEIWRLMVEKNHRIELLKEKQKFSRLVNELGKNYAVFSLNPDNTSFNFASESFESIFGVPSHQLLEQNFSLLPIDQENLQKIKQKHQALLDGKERFNSLTFSFQSDDGRTRFAKLTQHACIEDNIEIIAIDGLIEDITEQEMAQRKQQLAAKVFDYAQEGILITDAQANIIDVNDAFTDISGYQRHEIIGNNPRMFQSGRQDPQFYEDFWATLQKNGFWSGEVWNRRKNGEFYPQILNVSAIKDANDQIIQFIAISSDNSAQKDQQTALERIAHYDPLTQLPNRTLLTDRLNQALAYCDRHQTGLAVLFMDLDGFKEINDQYSHKAGDLLLIELANRFQSILRGEDTIARMGGDEFIGIIQEVDNEEKISPLLDRLLEATCTPFQYDGNTLTVSSSIGVTLYPQVENENIAPDQLIRQADEAMYVAKNKGKNQVQFYDDHINSLIKAETEAYRIQVMKGIKESSFCLYYQPKINIRLGVVIALEALIRWNHPEKGFLTPMDFLPKIKDRNTVVSLGYWVLETAFKQMHDWYPDSKNLSISINVEAELIDSPNFVENLQHTLEKYPNLKPEQVTLEILESSAIQDRDRVIKVINTCKEIGIHFAIDDFGVGYASLAYLRDFPVKELKVDQTFVKEMVENAQSLTILEAILSMGEAFNRRVIAEGAETDEHIRILSQLGYEFIQGYAISQPIPAEKTMPWLHSWQPQDKCPNHNALTKSGRLLLEGLLEQRVWVNQFMQYLDGEAELPDLDSSACKFGFWLRDKAPTLSISQDTLRQLDQLHSNLHASGQKCHQAHQIKDDDQAHAQLEQLRSTHHEMERVLEAVWEVVETN